MSLRSMLFRLIVDPFVLLLVLSALALWSVPLDSRVRQNAFAISLFLAFGVTSLARALRPREPGAPRKWRDFTSAGAGLLLSYSYLPGLSPRLVFVLQLLGFGGIIAATRGVVREVMSDAAERAR